MWGEMEHTSGVPGEPGAHLGMLVDGVIVEVAWNSLPARTTASPRFRCSSGIVADGIVNRGRYRQRICCFSRSTFITDDYLTI
jgi:hypothetical protein